MKTNIFKNCKDPVIQDTVDINEVLSWIVEGRFKDEIEKVRKYPKSTLEYSKFKNLIPTFSPNSTFEYKRNFDNIKNLTGLIYLDFDKFTDIELLKKFKFILAAWKSSGGFGYGALAKVEDLTLLNFSNTWTSIFDVFKGCNVDLDKQTKDITRQCIISYDPNIYINNDCKPFIASKNDNIKHSLTNFNLSIEDEFIINYESDLTATNNNTYTSDYSIDFNKFKYKTTLNDYDNHDFIVIPEGKGYRNAYLPKTIEVGYRHRWISSYTISILYNNRDINYKNLLKLILHVNKTHCNPSMQYDEIYNLTKWLFDKHVSNNLCYNTGLKRIWINPEAPLSKTEKRSLIGRESGKLRKDKTILIIQNAYNKLKIVDQKVTQKAIANLTGKSIRTIKRYWSFIVK
jgi:hypothetical protein